MKREQIIFTAPKTAELLTVDVPEITDTSVLTKMDYTVVSGGTERANIMAMPNARMLLGNHEVMMLQALGLGSCAHFVDEGDSVRLFGRWYRNGGQVTHQHWKHLRKSLRNEIAKYLVSLPVNIDITVNGIPYKLAHAEAIETYAYAWDKHRSKDSSEYAVWYRRYLEDTHPQDYTLVFGHTPTRQFQSGIPMSIFKDDNLIGIDCGCGYPDDTETRLQEQI